MIKIGVDATPLRNRLTGIGNYVYYLLKEMVETRPTYHFFLYAIRSSIHLDSFSKYKNVTVRISSFLGLSEALWSQTTLAWLIWRSELDIFWGATQSLPLICGVKSVITIYDFVYKLYPQSTSFIRGAYLRAFSRIFYNRANRIISISKGTAHRLNHLYNIQSDAVVIPPLKKIASFSTDVLKRHGLKSKNYFLAIGTLEPRKNISALVQAYPSKAPPLVIAGGKGWKDKEILQVLKKADQNVKALGYVAENDLMALLKEAKALLMPSLYEGYGMPLAEARSLGVPVICSQVPEMIEAAEDDFTIFKLNQLDHILSSSLPKPKKTTYPSNPQLANILLEQFEHLFNA
jgi:glycosyltransferase involved in cell wall biosynthesis